MRHGEAGAAASDELRGLTEAGRMYVRRAGALLADQPEAIDRVITSPLVRAVQTAEVLAGTLGLDAEITAHPEIAFPARVEQLLDVAAQVPVPARGIAIVGHEPTMGMLLERLLGPVARQVPFRTGTLWVLRWRRGQTRAEPVYAISGHPPARVALQP